MPTFIASEGDDFVVQYNSRRYNAPTVQALKVDGKTGSLLINGVVVDANLAVDQTARDAAAAAQATANNGILTSHVLTDADATITVAQGSEHKLPDATLTMDRTVTLDPTAGTDEVLRISRLDVTAHQLIVVNGGGGGGTIFTFPVSVKRVADFRFDGTNWVLSGFARLA
jgi:hypothetical protein